MPGTPHLSTLFVEGVDDKHSIIHLLNRHGVQPAVEITHQGNDRKVLEAMDVAIRLSGDRSVGFVLDVDKPTIDRWRQVCDRLRPFGLPLPESPPTEGYIGFSDEYRVHVGIWLMPDNIMDHGKLENLLRTLVPSNDSLIKHAEVATDEAHRLGALFTTNDRLKAVLSTWLAWQREPGVPYGTAIKAEFFNADSDVALRFVNWFKRLYNLS